MTKRADIPRVSTGIINLDALLEGGLPKSSVSVVSGPPGSGKTILTQQICFHNASAKNRVLCLGTLSEPTAKTLRHLQPFTFFDPKKIGESIQFVDLGVLLQNQGLEGASALVMQHVKRLKPALVVIDSFKVFDDLAKSQGELRKFVYEIAVQLMAWEATTLLLGEYGALDYTSKSLFAIVDGLILLSQQDSLGEHQRYLQIIKMRGTDHSRDEHPFLITPSGLQVFAPRAVTRLEHMRPASISRCVTHITKLDEILGTGIPWGSSLLIGGVAGTGKTVLSLEFIYRGALAGEKGIIFSFEETEERLRAAAQGLGWDLDKEIDRGMVEVVFIPQPDILVETHLMMMGERIEAMRAKRVVIDSISVFLHKVTNPQLSREKVFHLCSLVQNAQAVGFFPTDIPYGSNQVSRFGVEETVVDGVIILTSLEEGEERQRYVEVYKLRNTAHLKGRHNMLIEAGGVAIFPRYGDAQPEGAPPALVVASRLSSGVPGLDELLGGGFLKRSVTLVSGSAGIGKTLFGLQFILDGARRRERGLYVTLEEGPNQLLASADALDLPLRAMVKKGLVEILYVSRENIRAGQFLSVLADRLTTLEASRVVIDAASQMLTEHMDLHQLRHVLYKLVVRFKHLDITSVITLEAPSLLSTDRVTEVGLSPIADNLLMLRYIALGGQLTPTLTIVKTRGSDHERQTRSISVTQGGIHVGSVTTKTPAVDAERPRSRKRAPSARSRQR
ncbi:MAG: ATPase domain-containing protein [Deltaproteobacteria bacterium]